MWCWDRCSRATGDSWFAVTSFASATRSICGRPRSTSTADLMPSASSRRPLVTESSPDFDEPVLKVHCESTADPAERAEKSMFSAVSASSAVNVSRVATRSEVAGYDRPTKGGADEDANGDDPGGAAGSR